MIEKYGFKIAFVFIMLFLISFVLIPVNKDLFGWLVVISLILNILMIPILLLGTKDK